jgi:1,4-alpha-glucan branching enzyme
VAGQRVGDAGFGRSIEGFVHLLDAAFSNYPATKEMDGTAVPVAPFQYIDSHDHTYLLASFGIVNGIGGRDDIQFGDRAKFFRLQPFAIALYTCQGVPMLWQGQEFGENDILPGGGNARISIRREMHWEFFYDDAGRPLVRLYRILGRLRRTCRALRSRNSFYYFQQSRPTDGVVAYHRLAPARDADPEQVAVVFLNFTDHDQELQIPFPRAGAYRERIDDPLPDGTHRDVIVHADGEEQTITVPSNYGAIYITPA